MVGKRKRTVYRKSRKRRGFLGVQKQQCEDTEILQNQNENVIGNDESCPCPTQTVPLSASRRKLTQHEPQDKENDAEDDDSELPEYRFVDIQRLSSALSDVHKCEDGKFLVYFFANILCFQQLFNYFYFVSNFCLTKKHTVCFLLNICLSPACVCVKFPHDSCIIYTKHVQCIHNIFV